MLFSAAALDTTINIQEKYPEYVYTAELLERLGKDKNYIAECLRIAKSASLTLDPFFLGKVYSKDYVENKIPYSEETKEKNFEFLKVLVAQQFTNATPKEKPVYTVYPGAPGVGEPFHIESDFNADIKNNKFPQDAIILGPDLVVMMQMEEYRKACAMPEGTARTEAMVKAYTDARDFSNGATNLMHVMALTEKLNIIHDCTMTNVIAAKLLDTTKDCNYEIHGKIFLADKASRMGGLIARQKKYDGFALTTPDAILNKGSISFERVADNTYVGRFHKLSVYVQPEEFFNGKEPVKVAEFDPASGKMCAVPEGKVELERLISKLNAEDLTPEIKAQFIAVMQEWQNNTPEVTASRSLNNRV